MNDERLFIKVILPSQGKEKPNQSGGGKREPFKVLTPSLRQKFAAEIASVQAELEAARPYKPTIVPARVELESRALAKTHVPKNLFRADNR